MVGPCVQQKDDITALREPLLQADMAIFVTPLYYFGMSAHYQTLCRYMPESGHDPGKRLQPLVSMTKNSVFSRKAYELGKFLRD